MLSFRSLNKPKAAKLGLFAFVLGILVLHVLPNPTLVTSSGALIPYDWRLNFMSEYVRTQYGWLMTLNFCILGMTALFGMCAFNEVDLKREVKLMIVTALGCFLLAVFPTDLADLTINAGNCSSLLRVEPCTWVGQVHNPLSSVVFLALALVWLSIAKRRRIEWKPIVVAGWVCFALAIVLSGLSSIYLSHIIHTQRHWFGLMQRSITVSAVTWLWLVFSKMRHLQS